MGSSSEFFEKLQDLIRNLLRFGQETSSLPRTPYHNPFETILEVPLENLFKICLKKSTENSLKVPEETSLVHESLSGNSLSVYLTTLSEFLYTFS